MLKGFLHPDLIVAVFLLITLGQALPFSNIYNDLKSTRDCACCFLKTKSCRSCLLSGKHCHEKRNTINQHAHHQNHNNTSTHQNKVQNANPAHLKISSLPCNTTPPTDSFSLQLIHFIVVPDFVHLNQITQSPQWFAGTLSFYTHLNPPPFPPPKPAA